MSGIDSIAYKLCGLTAGEARVCRVDDPADGVRGRAGVAFLTQRHRVTEAQRGRGEGLSVPLCLRASVLKPQEPDAKYKLTAGEGAFVESMGNQEE